jgi:hypothetical protein
VKHNLVNTIGIAIRLGLNPTKSGKRCTESLRFKFSKIDGAIEEATSVAAFGEFTDEPGELVRIYIDLDDLVGRSIIGQSIDVALSQFLVSGWEIAYLETQEGFKIFLRNDREKHLIHLDSLISVG